jgi:hypothetical protein
MYRGCFSLGCMCKTGWGKAVLEDIQTYTYVTNQIMYLHLGRLSLGNLVKKDLLCQDCYKFSQGKAIFGSGTRRWKCRVGPEFPGRWLLEDDFMTANGKDDESTWSCNMLQQPPGGHWKTLTEIDRNLKKQNMGQLDQDGVVATGQVGNLVHSSHPTGAKFGDPERWTISSSSQGCPLALCCLDEARGRQELVRIVTLLWPDPHRSLIWSWKTVLFCEAELVGQESSCFFYHESQPNRISLALSS